MTQPLRFFCFTWHHLGSLLGCIWLVAGFGWNMQEGFFSQYIRHFIVSLNGCFSLPGLLGLPHSLVVLGWLDCFCGGWLRRKGNIPRSAKAADFLRSHAVSLLSHTLGPTWSKGQPRFIGRGKRKKKEEEKQRIFSHLLIHLKMILLWGGGHK